MILNLIVSIDNTAKKTVANICVDALVLAPT